MATKTVYFKHSLVSLIRSLFFWILELLFFAFCTLTFFIKSQFFTPNGTSSLINFFANIPYFCILAIPALCYKRSDSIYDDFIPLKKSTQIITRYLSLLVSFCVMLIPFLLVPIFVNFYGDVDGGSVFVSFICLVLYGASSVALCVMCQAIFENSILSFVISALVLAVINSSHKAAIYISANSFITSVSNFISFGWRFDSASKGIISSSDCAFFILTAVLFLAISCYISLKKCGKQYKSPTKRTIFYSFAILVLLICNFERYSFNLDLSKDKSYSLSKYTKNLLNEATDTIKITYYKSRSLENLYPQVRSVGDYLNTYTKQNRNIILKTIDCDKNEDAKNLLTNYGIYPQRIRTVNSNSTEYLNVYSCIIIEVAGRIESIPFVMSSQSLEYDLDTRILSQAFGVQNTVNILMGNGMSLVDDYSYLIQWLESQGFFVYEVTAQDLYKTDGALLVIGESEIDFDESVLIEEYVNSGKGNVLFSVNPFSADIFSDWKITKNENDYVSAMLKNYGINFRDSIVSDLSCSRITMYSDDSDHNYAEVINYPLWISLLPQVNTNLGVNVFWAVPLELSGNAVPYLVTSSFAWENEIDYVVPEKLIETNPFYVKDMTVSKEKYGTYIVAAKTSAGESDNSNGETIGNKNSLKSNVSGGRKTDIYVISDQYFLNSLINGYAGGESGDYRNYMFVTNLLLKMNGQEELAKLQNKTIANTTLYKREIGIIVKQLEK